MLRRDGVLAKKMTSRDSDHRYLVKAAQMLFDSGRSASARELLRRVLHAPQDLPVLRELQLLSSRLSSTDAAMNDFQLPQWRGYDGKNRPASRCLTILDEISEVNWSTDFRCTRLRRTADFSQLQNEEYDFILIESAWLGNQGDWIYAFTSNNLEHEYSRLLLSKLNYARDCLDKPIIMINKEDPMHFEKFLPIMKYADHIFTTDEEMVPLYHQNTAALTVTAMPFAANMTLTNPVGRVDELQEALCFAGSYYGRGHDERVRQMEYLLAPITEFGGVIYDRQSENPDPIYRYPKRFANHIRRSVDFLEMVPLYRRFRVFLNVNTIVSSPTMMARRVYELLACGTPVVSAPSRAMEEQFSGIVALASTEKEACEAVDRLITDENHWWKTSQKGIREIALRHQYRQRADQMRLIVWGEAPPNTQPLVSLVVKLSSSLLLAQIIRCIAQQNYPRIEAIFIVNESTSAENMQFIANALSGVIERVNFSKHTNEISLGSQLVASLAMAEGEYFAIFDDRDWYLPNYLTDMILTFAFSGADVAGKSTYPVWSTESDKVVLSNPGNQHKVSSRLCHSTLVGNVSWVRRIARSANDRRFEFDIVRETINARGKLYSADHFNFVGFHTAGSSDASTERVVVNRAHITEARWVDHWVV